MKLTRNQLKSIMKECLTELINEGMLDKHFEKLAEGKKLSSSGMLYGNGNQRSNFATPPEKTPTGEINPKLIQAVQNVVSATSGAKRSMFESIMMDTAMTTLQEQNANGDGFGAAAALNQEIPVSPVVAARDEAVLQAMSGGNLSRWATAAFGGKKK